MTISFSRYINIVSGVGGAAAIPGRIFMLRLFTTNVLLPPTTYAEFSNANDVGTFFGFASAEYARAQFYFGWVSKLISSPPKISFARWCESAVAPSIYGSATPAPSLAALNAVTAGGFTLTVAGTPTAFTGLDLAAAGSLSAVAAAVQSKIQSGSGAMFTDATVTYDASRGAFDLVMGTTGAATFAVTDGAQTPLALLNWTAASGAAIGVGEGAETITEVLTASTAASNNFGSFDFIPYFDQAQVVEAATWNAAQSINFIYCQAAAATDAVNFGTATLGLAGTGITAVTATDGDDFMEMAPGIIFAATQYNTGRLVSQNYMYQLFPTMPVSVSSDAVADAYDAVRVNYNGITQDNGATIAFYQRGVLGGGLDAATDMQAYADAAWIADAAGVQLMNLQLAMGQIPANSAGITMMTTQLVQGVIGGTGQQGTALYNGVISVGKKLSVLQQQYITSLAGDPVAWRKVQNQGWWLTVSISSIVTEDNRTEYQANYLLIYSKNDFVRKVNGQHTLI